MKNETKLGRSIHMICASGLAFGAHAVYAQEDTEPVQKVLITGSRIASPRR